MSKKTNYDLINTDSSTSTYDNIYSIKRTKYNYNSDSSFKLSSTTSSSSINKQQHHKKDNPSNRLQQISKIFNKKERNNYTNHKHKFNKHVDKYIATRKNITTIKTSRCNSTKPHNNIKNNSTTKIKKRNLHQSTHVTTTDNNSHLEEYSELAKYNVVTSTFLNRPLDMRHYKIKTTYLLIK